MIATRRPAASAAARMRWMRSACSERSPCEKLSRATFRPARMRRSSMSGVSEAGPIVATILVLLLGSAIRIWFWQLAILRDWANSDSNGLRGVALCHLGEWNRLVVPGVPGLAEFSHALRDHLLHRFPCRLQVAARIELLGMFREHLADRTGHRQPVVGIHVDFADAILDAKLDFLHGHTPGRFQLAAVPVDDLLQVLRHARRSVHHKVDVRKFLVNFYQPLHLQGLACRRLR